MTTTHGFDRAAITLGLASIASLVFVAEQLGEYRFVHISGASAVIAAVLGVLALVAGLMRSRLLELVAGLGFAAAAAAVLIDVLTEGDRLGANLSAMSLWLGLALGLLLAGSARRDVPNTTVNIEGN